MEHSQGGLDPATRGSPVGAIADNLTLSGEPR